MGFFDYIGSLGGQAKTGISSAWDAGANSDTGSKLLSMATWSAGSGLGKVERNLCYPLDMNSPENRNRPALMMTLYDDREGLNNAYNIFLPIPASIQFSDSASYNNIELNAAAKIGLDAVNSGSAKSAIEGFGSDVGRSQLRDVGAAANGIVRGVNDGLRSVIGFGLVPRAITSAVGVYAATTINKNVITTFGGVATRAYSYAYKMIASSQKEADVIRKIHSVFRVGLYPDGTNIALRYPPRWTIRFIDLTTGKDLEHVPKIYECFLTSTGCSLNSSTNMWREGNAPIEVDVSVSFMETKALTVRELVQLEEHGFKKEIFTQNKLPYPTQTPKPVSSNVPTSTNFGTPTPPPGGFDAAIPDLPMGFGEGIVEDGSVLPPRQYKS